MARLLFCIICDRSEGRDEGEPHQLDQDIRVTSSICGSLKCLRGGPDKVKTHLLILYDSIMTDFMLWGLTVAELL